MSYDDDYSEEKGFKLDLDGDDDDLDLNEPLDGDLGPIELEVEDDDPDNRYH